MKIKYRAMTNFENIVKGDTVIAQVGMGTESRHRTYNVSRLTKTQIVCEDGSRFKRINGRQVGSETGQWAWLHKIYLFGKVEPNIEEIENRKK